MPFIENVPALRAIIGFILVFFLPGFAWSLVIFRNIIVLERIGLSIALSIALVTLSIIGLNMALHMKINGANALLVVIALTVLPAGIYLFKRLRKHQTGDAGGN